MRDRLATVSFKSDDLNLLRGGPKYRRDWIDRLLTILRVSYGTLANRYQKILTQRNRLLKEFLEKGKLRLAGPDREHLKVFDQQAASLGAQIIKQRVDCLNRLIPEAERYQQLISGKRDRLTIAYHFRTPDQLSAEGEEAVTEDGGIPAQDLAEMEEREIASILVNLFARRSQEEIVRKQTLTGPHRDDVRLLLNGADATAFASQGQQRSLVLALKLAELELLVNHLEEAPVLLLDDVLAELDLNRQGFLMASVRRAGDNLGSLPVQTIITTTHVDGFRPEWLEDASFLAVTEGSAQERPCPV